MNKEVVQESVDAKQMLEDFNEVRAEELAKSQDSRNEWLAELRKQLAESKEIMREMIGRMNDEEVMELADMCLDELEIREYSVLRLCVNQERVGSAYMLDVVGNVAHIASSLIYLGVKKELFAKCLKAVVAALEQKKMSLRPLSMKIWAMPRRKNNTNLKNSRQWEISTYL